MFTWCVIYTLLNEVTMICKVFHILVVSHELDDNVLISPQIILYNYFLPAWYKHGSKGGKREENFYTRSKNVIRM